MMQTRFGPTARESGRQINPERVRRDEVGGRGQTLLIQIDPVRQSQITEPPCVDTETEAEGSFNIDIKVESVSVVDRQRCKQLGHHVT